MVLERKELVSRDEDHAECCQLQPNAEMFVGGWT